MKLQQREDGTCSLKDIKTASYTAFRRANLKAVRGMAQPGSAPALGAGSRGFKSLCPDHLFSMSYAELLLSRVFIVCDSVCDFSSGILENHHRMSLSLTNAVQVDLGGGSILMP